MKKLNSKGFTLVELLAVIIILAIVVGITIPAVTTTINTSKNNALNVALDTAENWIAEQYALYNTLGSTGAGVSTSFKNAYSEILNKDGPTTKAAVSTLLVDAGLSTKNFSLAHVYLNETTGKVCVTMEKVTLDGQYYNTTIWAPTGALKTGNTQNEIVLSKSCSSAATSAAAAA